MEKTVQLIYGGGSIKKMVIYNQVMRLLKDNEKVVVEDGGVMPNPTVEKLRRVFGLPERIMWTFCWL